MDAIRGMLLPLPTVFDEQGRIDEPTLRQMIDYYVGAGINAMFVGGSMGQGMALTQDERKALFDIAIGQIKGRIPVVCHVGTADPYTTIDLGRYALKAGAAALAMVGPYYYSDRTPAELRAHFKMVGKELKAPTLLYNNPKYQGYPISGELMAQFVEDSPQIFGCKLAKGGVDEAVAYRQSLGPKFKLFAMASSLYPGMLLGITGTVSPPLTLCPEIGVACVRAIDEGNYTRALELQRAIVELQGALLSPTIRKIAGRGVYLTGLRELGFPIKVYPRWPVAEVPKQGVEAIRETLRVARSVLDKKAA
ncbi:MAG: dihydrodipicolinate synthase family protein [Gemmatimonas sp.]